MNDDFDGRVKAAPAVRRIARENGVDLREVIPGGEDGRITVVDIESYIAAKRSVQEALAAMDREEFGEVASTESAPIEPVKAQAEIGAYTAEPVQQSDAPSGAQHDNADEFTMGVYVPSSAADDTEDYLISKEDLTSAKEEPAYTGAYSAVGISVPSAESEEIGTEPEPSEGNEVPPASDTISPEAVPDESFDSGAADNQAVSAPEGEEPVTEENVQEDEEPVSEDELRNARKIMRLRPAKPETPNENDFEDIAQDALSKDQNDLLSSLYDGYIAEKPDEDKEDNYENIIDEDSEDTIKTVPQAREDTGEDDEAKEETGSNAGHETVGRVYFSVEKRFFDALVDISAGTLDSGYRRCLAKALALAFRNSGDYPENLDVVAPTTDGFEKLTYVSAASTPLNQILRDPSEEHPDVLAELWDMRDFGVDGVEFFASGKMRFFVNSNDKMMNVNIVFDLRTISVFDALTVSGHFKDILCDPLSEARRFIM